MPHYDSIKVLVIDDDEVFLDAINIVLTKEKYEVLSASNGEIGINLLKEQNLSKKIVGNKSDNTKNNPANQNVCVQVR